jgi:predicted RNA-binding protein with PUA-like domain
MLKDMKVGDRALFYHSNSKEIGIVGIAVVTKKAYPDLTALDKKDEHFDSKATKDKPVWYGVDFKYEKTLKKVVTLEQIKQESKLRGISVAKKGNRLSVMPITRQQYEHIVKLGRR